MESSVLSLHHHVLPPRSPAITNHRHHFKLKALASSPPSPSSSTQTKRPNHRRNRSRKQPSRRTNKRRQFAEKDAFPGSLPLHTRNPIGIYKDVQRFARQDKLDEALAIMDYVDQRGIPVNPTTFSALIAACVRTKSLDHGRQVHVHIRINGLEGNEFLRTKLVHMYTCCGSVEDAKKVFDECPCSSVYPWNALLRGTVISGRKRYGDVLSGYMEMRAMGVELNEYSFSSVIKSFAGASALKQGLKTHALLVKNGMVGSSVLLTSLIDLYFKCGKVRLARKVFEELRERDIVVWGAMIAGFAHNRRHIQALDYVRWMVSEGVYPNSVILITILPVIGQVWAKRLGQEVHGYVMKTKGYMRQLPLQSGLIDMYCKCGDMGSGRRVFYGSVERNVISWTALMSGYASNARLEQALRSVVWMQQEGFRPDVVTVATAIPVCTKLKDLKHGKEMHAYAVKNLFLPNVSISTSLMKLYSECGILDYSVKLFDAMRNRNVISWTAMIDSYAENGSINEALDVFRSMQLSKHRPDSVAIARILSVCSEIAALKLGKEIHGHILKKNFDSIPFVVAEIVKFYGRCGLIYQAKRVFNGIPIQGSITWTAIIEAYGYTSQWKEAMNLFDKMRSGGFTPNEFTLKALLSICDHAGLVDDACKILKLMSQEYKVKASQEHYSVIIELLKRSGRAEEAQRFIQISTTCSS